MARVLIVDDDAALRELFVTVLGEYSAHETVTTENGALALAMIDAGEIFDLVVTDLRMPVMTGQELIAALRGRGNTVPIILVTGDVRPPAIEGVRTVRKPFTIGVLIAEVEQALRRHSD